MPGQTPNRHYPYPIPADPLKPSADIRLLAEALDDDAPNFVKSSGDTLTGSLDMGGFQITNLNLTPNGPGVATPKDYVDTTTVSRAGDTMTGPLQIGGKPGTGGAGVELFNEGAITARRGRESGPIVVLTRGVNLGGMVDESYIRFMNNADPDEQAGNITLQSGPTVHYGTTSDYRLKEERGPIDDPLRLLGELRPLRYVWTSDPDHHEHDGFLAHEVAEVVPDAVTGAKDAVRQNGEIIPQQLDPAKIVPLLVAAVQDLAAQVAALRSAS